MPEKVEDYTDRIIEKTDSLIRSGVLESQWPANIREVNKRWVVAHNMLLDFTHEGSRYILNLYKARFPDLNDTQARLDIRASQVVYGKMSRHTREFKRTLAIERIEKQAAIAANEKEWKSQIGLESVLQRYLDPASDPIDGPNWEELLANVNVEITYEPELIGVVRVSKEERDQLEKSVQKKRDINIQDAEFEDIPVQRTPEQLEAENE